MFIERIKTSSLVKDSFWAVFGNGVGYLLLLISGILIARYLGSDLYGEYGIVKSTMFMAALFATFGLGDTSTRFIAQSVKMDVTNVRNIAKDSFVIVFIFSGLLCSGLFLFADSLAAYIGHVQLATSFKFLGIIIIFRAINTVGAGILGGLKKYKLLGINNIISGIIMLGLCVPLTRVYSLSGALWSLMLSQMALGVLNVLGVHLNIRTIMPRSGKHFKKQIIIFSFPFAMNELIYSVVNWGISIIFAKFASMGEYGIFSASMQWNAIILFMPSLLGNVILSHLSTTSISDRLKHKILVRRMLIINFLCTLLPLVLLMIFSNYVAEYYGHTFIDLKYVLRVTVLGTLFISMTRVFQSNLMSEGKKWEAFIIRSTYNIIYFLVAYLILRLTNGENAAINVAILTVFINFLAFVLYGILYFKRS